MHVLSIGLEALQRLPEARPEVLQPVMVLARPLNPLLHVRLALNAAPDTWLRGSCQNAVNKITFGYMHTCAFCLYDNTDDYIM